MKLLFIFNSLPGLPKDFVPKDPKLLLPKDFQPNKEFHPKIGNDDDDYGDDLDNSDTYPPMPGTLPRTKAGYGTSLFISVFLLLSRRQFHLHDFRNPSQYLS